tara:strand:- start:946 stop:1194 length:249 start_codon:yes stop_codon:yes gene_type:complete
MSQRLGMADGRCFTISTSSQLLNDYVMNSNGVALADNYSYRKLLQQKGPQLVDEIQAMQQSGGRAPHCQSCDKPLLKVPNTY